MRVVPIDLLYNGIDNENSSENGTKLNKNPCLFVMG